MIASSPVFLSNVQLLREYYPEFHAWRKDKAVPAREAITRAVNNISPSQLANGCDLVVYYKLIGEPGVDSNRTYDNCLILDTGTEMHEILQLFFKWVYATKVRNFMYLHENSIVVSDSCKGTTDGAVFTLDFGSLMMEDYKSCSQSVYDSVTTKPLPYHAFQLRTYMAGNRVNNILGRPADFGRITYVNRSNGVAKDCAVDPSIEEQDKILRKIEFITECAAKRSTPTPHKHYLGKDPCTKVCTHRHLCPLAKAPTNRRL